MHIARMRNAGIRHGGAHAGCNRIDLRAPTQMLEGERRGMGAADRKRRALPGVPVHALEDNPMRRHGAFGAARHHQADFGGLIVRHESPEQQGELQVRKAAAEIVDQAVAFGLAEHGNHAAGIDPAGGNRRLDPRNVVGRRGGDAVDLCDRHAGPPSPLSSRCGEACARSWAGGTND